MNRSASGGFAALLGRSGPARVAILLLLLAINGAVAWNAARHDVRIGYDAPRHLKYAETLAEGRLPTPKDTPQFYVPPLPYVFPALLHSGLRLEIETAARATLLLQAGLSLGLCLLTLALAQSIRPNDDVAKVASLAFLGMPAVYYRTFAMLRGEPYLAFFTALSVLLVLRTLRKESFTPWLALTLGLTWGALALSRQWGLVIVGATLGFSLLLILRRRHQRRILLPTLAVAMAISLISSAWFYVDPLMKPERRFNRKVRSSPPQIAAKLNRFKLESAGLEIFRNPGRPSFRYAPVAILYSDWWGDYHYYFLYRDAFLRDNSLCLAGWILAHRKLHEPLAQVESNHFQMSNYLGRLNFFAVLPTLILAVGLMMGAASLVWAVIRQRPPPRIDGLALVTTLTIATLMAHAGAAFLLLGNSESIQILKASYDLQLLPLVALLGGEVFARLRRRSGFATGLLAAALLLISLYGYGAAFTRWPAPQNCIVSGENEPPRVRNLS